MTRTAIRQSRLKDMLRGLRRQMQSDIEARRRVGRSATPPEVGRERDRTKTNAEGALALALLKLKLETLVRIHQALVRLDEGRYGRCLTCDLEIAERRLRTAPFAIRCRACEGTREQTRARVSSSPERPDGLFVDGLGL